MGIESVEVVIDLVKAVGFSAIIFVIWIITLKFFEKILNQQKSYFEDIAKEQSKRNEENFQVLNKFAESVEFLGGQMSQINGKVDNNRFCPVVRDETRQPPEA